jgi:peptidyl-tRNA hydrolase, PTH1 family
MSKFLVVGLGNVGEDYAGTRHNIGFDIVDEIAAQDAVKWKNDRLAFVAETKFRGRTLILVKPTTFMNLSGKAVQYWMQAEKIPLTNVLVLVDELALPFGKIRLGPKGSDGGHNGLKSIQESIGTTNYPRLRFGIGNAEGKGYGVNYVLGKWNSEEQKSLGGRIKLAAEAVRSFAFIGLERTATLFNGK